MNYLLKNKFLLLGALFAIFAAASLPDVLAMKRKHTDDENHLPTKKAKIDDGKQEESDDMNIDDSSTSTTLLNLPFDTLNIITEYVINDQENPATRYKLGETCTVFHEILFLGCIKDRIKQAYSSNNQTRINALQKLCNLVIISPQFATFNDRFGEDIIEQIIKTALDNSSHQDWRVIMPALQLFTALVNNDQGFDAAITAATKNSSHWKSWVSNSALGLFIALFDKNQGFDAAITAATLNSDHPNSDLSNSALRLFTALFDKNHGFDAAIRAATLNSDHPNWDIRKSALQLFTALVNNDQGFDAAITAATKNSSDWDLSTRSSALQLFTALVNKDQGFDAAIKAATQNSSHWRSLVSNSALQLFTALVNKNQGFDAAIKAATQNSPHWDLSIRKSALQLITALVKQNYQPAYEMAKKIDLPDPNSLEYGELQNAIQAYEQCNPSSWSCLIQ